MNMLRSLVIVAFCALASSAKILRYPIKQRKTQLPTRRDAQRERRTKGVQVTDEDFLDDMYRGRGVHYVDLFVGCPPQQQSVIVNTGSDDTGFPCAGGCDVETCGEDYHLHNFFDENSSSCFSRPSCDDCTLTPGSCVEGDICSVEASYAEGSSWYGSEVEDMVSSGGTDEDPFPFRFACENEVTGLFRTQLSDGILGMANSDESYWKQAYDADLIEDKRFSLCHVLHQDLEEEAGVMVLGGSDTRMHKTKMAYAKDIPGSMYYQVRVKEIQLRTDASNATVEVSTSGSYDSTTTKMTIVSGDTCTYLNQNLRGPLEEAWDRLADFPFLSGVFDESELDSLPTFVFVLEGVLDEDVMVTFPPTRYLENDGSGSYTPCLETDATGSGELGNNFLSGHDVLFDIENGLIGFAESDCETPDDGLPAAAAMATTATGSTAAGTTAKAATTSLPPAKEEDVDDSGESTVPSAQEVEDPHGQGILEAEKQGAGGSEEDEEDMWDSADDMWLGDAVEVAAQKGGVAMLVVSALVVAAVFAVMAVMLKKIWSKKPEPVVEVVADVVEATPVV